MPLLGCHWSRPLASRGLTLDNGRHERTGSSLEKLETVSRPGSPSADELIVLQPFERPLDGSTVH